MLSIYKMELNEVLSKYVIGGSCSNAVVMSRVYSSEPAEVWDLSGDPGFPAC